MKGSDLTPLDYKRERRQRRMRRNVDVRGDVEAWAARHGFSLRVNNDGHHWMFHKHGFLAEWWPSSAKLVFNRDYHHDLHAHDWRQVTNELEAAMRRLRSSP